MGLDLTAIKRTKVSRDLRGKFIFIYGSPKIGKTTLAVKFPNSLLGAVEHGYNLIADVAPIDIENWAKFKQVVKALGEPESKNMYQTFIIDTIGILYGYCTDYICNREGVETIGDVPYGAGYSMVDKEFESTLRKITQYANEDGSLCYGLVFIGHSKARKAEEEGDETVVNIVPDMPDRCAAIINKMVDITAYLGNEEGKRYIYPRDYSFTKGNTTYNIHAGNHATNLNEKIPLDYNSFVEAIKQAIDTETTKDNYTDAPTQATKAVTYEKDFKTIKSEIGALVKKFKAKDEADEDDSNMNFYTNVLSQYLGKGRLVKDCDENQMDMLVLILEELTEYAKKNKIIK